MDLFAKIMPNPSTFPRNEQSPTGKESSPHTQTRAFRYGDGLFETLLVRRGRAWNAESHLHRMLIGMETLGFEFEQEEWLQKMKAELYRLSSTVPKERFGRIRIQVFRSGGGAYLPETDVPDYVAEVSILESDPWESPEAIKIGIYSDIPLSFSPLSAVKSTNSLPYILAARYAHQQGWDDALLLSSDGNVAESSKSNLFYIRGQQLITPVLSSGCLPGTMRSAALKLGVKLGYEVREENVSLTDLSTADAIFLSNAIRGLVPVKEIESMPWTTVSDEVRSTLMDALPNHTK